MNARGLGLFWGLLVLTLAGCGEPVGSVEASRYRFVDPEHREEADLLPPRLARWSADMGVTEGGFPVAGLKGDRRLVLFSPPQTRRRSLPPVEPFPDGSLEVEILLPPPLTDADEVVIRPNARQGKEWIWWLPSSHRIETLGSGRRGVRLTLRHPKLVEGEPVKVWFDTFWPPAAGRSGYRTRRIVVPYKASLTFSVASLVSSPETPVHFRVSFCEGEDCMVLFEEAIATSVFDESPWHDRRVSLEGASRRTGRFFFETWIQNPLPGNFAAPVWANPVVAAPGAGADGPSVILVSLDTLRADHLSTYGYARQTSPSLTRFAEKGTLLERCISAATRTEASHMSMFTSLPPSQHGTTVGPMPLVAPVPTLAELIRAEGLATAAITENGPLAARIGFGHGFDMYVENKSPILMRPQGYVGETLERAKQWLERNGQRRFFLFLHTYEVHAPYEPPPEYRELFADGLTSGLHERVRTKVDDYDREIRYTDEVLGDFIAWLERRGFDERTIVVVTSDHGEEFLEHGMVGHEGLPYDVLLHVPLIWRGPGIAPGRRVAETVSHLDLMPTLLEMLGASLPDHLQGRSYASWLGPGASPDGDSERVFLSESWGRLGRGFERPAEAVQRGTDKLIRLRRAGRFEYRLYDLEADPGEQADRANQDFEKVESLSGVLREIEAVVSGTEENGYDLDLDPQRKEKLRALGYLE